MKWLDEKLTQISVFVIKKMHWENKRTNQQAISFFIGSLIGWMVILLMAK